MEECVVEMNNHPMCGANGLYYVNHPLTFAQFGFLAYEHGVLTSEAGLNELGAQYGSLLKPEQPLDLHNPSESDELPRVDLQTAIKSAMNQGKRVFDVDNSDGGHSMDELEEGFVFDDIEYNDEEIGYEGNGEHLNVPIDSFGEHDCESSQSPQTSHVKEDTDTLSERCLIAEARVQSLETLLNEKDNEILLLKAKLQSAQEECQRYMGAADLANKKVREVRSGDSSEIISGLKPEFKPVNAKLATLAAVLKNFKVNHNEMLLDILMTLEEIPDQFDNSLKAAAEVASDIVAKSNESMAKAVEANTSKIDLIWNSLKGCGDLDGGQSGKADVSTVSTQSDVIGKKSKAVQTSAIRGCKNGCSLGNSGLVTPSFGKGRDNCPPRKRSKLETTPVTRNKLDTPSNRSNRVSEGVKRSLFHSSGNTGSSSDLGNSSMEVWCTNSRDVGDRSGSYSNMTNNGSRHQKFSYPVWAKKPQNF